MLTQTVFLLFGLILLLISADRMIHYSDQVAKYYKVSPILIGLTLVAFGTSAPELVITLFASFNSPPNTDAIIGNVVGSNIANILLILGFSGLFFNLDFGKVTKKDIFYLSLISLYFVSAFYLINKANNIYLVGFVILILLFYNNIRNYPLEKNNEHNLNFSNKIYIFLILSFIGIFYGGNIFLSQALLIFKEIGLSEAIIGVTVLAIGTSLPELITVLISYFKKMGDIGIGNIIGSNIMNLLFVFAPSLIIIQLRGYEYVLASLDKEIIMVFILSTIFLIILALFKIILSRLIAILLLTCYLAYILRVLL